MSRASRIATNVYNTLVAAQGKPILFFPDLLIRELSQALVVLAIVVALGALVGVAVGVAGRSVAVSDRRAPSRAGRRADRRADRRGRGRNRAAATSLGAPGPGVRGRAATGRRSSGRAAPPLTSSRRARSGVGGVGGARRGHDLVDLFLGDQLA